MPLKLDVFDVWMPRPDDQLTDPDLAPDYTVVVRTGDQMRGELEAKRLLRVSGLREAPLNVTALFIWAAMARNGHTDQTAQEWMADVPEFSPVKDQDDDEVNPTKLQPGAPA